MKKAVVMTLMFLLGTQAFASESLIWACRKGNNPYAVTVSVNPNGGESPYIVRINDVQIAASLGLKAPFASDAKYYGYNYNGASGYVALAGEYASGVAMFGDHGGIKLEAVASTSEGIRAYPSANWYFNPGACVRASTVR